ncbi:hypothetical protein NFI95_15425 [Acetobacteraceae bacterium KSS8]|uniref:Uncharacterized protein n=1 Tax=Endosaccharibacter trunci TaxID=2812733 RepID=A0ABT1WAB3_9PROT|nr:hypothetical protein [Acetobacteraceae bacterium KSS8]
MGWANCGHDSKGRPIGYAHSATCDHPGCDAQIHRGVAYACGGDHGEAEWSCDGYFCNRHRNKYLPIEGWIVGVCQKDYDEAKAYAIKSPELAQELVRFFEEDEGPDWRGPEANQ